MKSNLFILLACLALASCGGLSTFHEYARAGDTVAVPVGMKSNFSKDNVIVTITPSSGSDIVLNPADPAIRAIFNLYPDPISNMIVSREINENLTPGAQDYAAATLFKANNEKDYYQTTLFVDLPATLPDGLTQIQVSNGLGTSHTVTLEVVPGVGAANSFNSDFNGGYALNNVMLDSLSRAPHHTVYFDTGTIPHAVEINFTHDPDITIGGVGQAFVTNPLGYLKNLSWSDNGTALKVIMMQSKDGIINDMSDYKFYITGTATNLVMGSVQGYDINGNNIAGVNATIISSN